MHQIHTTPGFIIDSRPYGEAGKVISIFTRDFGLVAATAQGIRLEKSKLRYHAQLHSLGVFSLVRGKEFWRLTSAQGRDANLRPIDANTRMGTQELITRIALLLRRLLHGEEARPQVFDAIEASVLFMDEDRAALNEERLATLESLTVARILHWLGYIGADAELSGRMESFEVTNVLLDALSGKRTTLNTHINKALRESQL